MGRDAHQAAKRLRINRYSHLENLTPKSSQLENLTLKCKHLSQVKFILPYVKKYAGTWASVREGWPWPP